MTREAIDTELLEYLYGCHADPAALEARLVSDPDLRERLEAMRATKGVLDQAAQEPTRLVLTPPAPGRRSPFKPVAAAALLLIGLAPWGWTAFARREVQGLERQYLRLVVSGPRGVPDGAPARVRVETWDLDGGPGDARVSWVARDAQGEVLSEGAQDSDGALDLDLPAHLTGLRRVEVRAERAGIVREAAFDLRPGASAPLAHLTSDKPVYRPGETAWLRAVVLDRLSLAAREGWTHLRIVDPRGATVETFRPSLEDGVGALVWSVSEDAVGGEYALELRDASDSFVVERLPLQVRRFQPPQLAKTLDLDRETYSPGETGRAELRVTRIEGGIPAGAAVDASLVIDGALCWSERGELDARGHVLFDFVLPPSVARGDARFVARVVDGGVTETAIEPFVVPVGGLRADLYPEGGELVAGVPTRVYVEVTDPLDRAATARGVVVDATGARVAGFETSHQGRARFAFTPRSGASYRLELEGEQGAIDLPAVTAGVGLRALADTYPAGSPLDLVVNTPNVGPWYAGVFCRGALVAQDSFSGKGEHDLTLEVPDDVAGVLRVTVFDASLAPVAERLVHRESGRALRVAVRPLDDQTLPGAKQEVAIEVIDETGRPVSAVLGVAVTDRAVREAAGEERVGLADQTWLCGDVEELEDVEDFLATTPEGRRNVDLLLGTRGWRRFAWLDAGKLQEEHGDAGRRLLVREGHGGEPQVADEREDVPALLGTARRGARDARQRAGLISVLAGLAAAIWALGELLMLVPWLRERRPLAFGAYAGTVVGGLVLAAFLLNRSGAVMPGADGTVVLMAAMEQEPPQAFAAGGHGPVALTGMDAGLVYSAFTPAGYFGVGWGDQGVDEGTVEGTRAYGVYNSSTGTWTRARDPGAGGRGGGGQGPEIPEALFGGAGGAAAGDAANADSFPLVPFAPADRWARVYAHQRQPRDPNAPRSDFSETVYWNALLKTAADGTARFAFDLSDRVTTWEVVVDAHGASRVGQASGGFEAVPPFHLTAKLPVELSEGDRIQLPVSLVSGDESAAEAGFSAAVQGPLALTGDVAGVVALAEGRGRVLLPIEVTGSGQRARIAIAGQALGFGDRAVRDLRVVPRGFPHRVSRGGRVAATAEFELGVPAEFVPGSLSTRLVLYPAPLAGLFDGAAAMLQEPHGCFEQTSATHYPNVLAMAYLRASGTDSPAEVARAQALIGRGYQRLVGFECSKLGFEWFGSDPGHEVLSAYGLLEFSETAAVSDLVDDEMVARTRAWLMGRRDGEGGFELDPASLDSFGRAAPEVTNAYCTYALVLSGTPPAEVGVELDHLERRALEADDPYEVALAAAALQAAGRAEAARGARGRLKTWQQTDGSLVGTNSTITRSGGDALAVETTSLAILAWLAGPEDATAHVQRALDFVLTRRSGRGFGGTQATVQALRALTAYAQANRRVASAGELIVRFDDYEVARLSFEAGRREPLELVGLEQHLTPGNHRVGLEVTGGNDFPFAFDLEYFAETPASDPECVIGLETYLARELIEEGKTVALQATVENRSDEGQPMTIAILGLPAGLRAPREVLDDLQAAGRFDLWELRGREVVLYWRDLAPREVREVTIDLVGRIPGETTGPASRAYLYYTPESKTWSAPLAIEVTATRPR